MKQRWNHIFFLHGKIAPSLLQPYLPFELDLLDGVAILSIVAFKMDMIRLWNFPPAPFFSHLWEINLRTYVRVGGKPGVYFFTLDTDSPLGYLIANCFFHLPYRLAKIKALVRKKHFYFESQRSLASFKTSFCITGRKKKKTILDRWATDRERLFTLKRGEIYEGRVHHESWPLEEVENLIFEDHFSTQIPIECHFDPQESSYARVLNVSFETFRKASGSSSLLRPIGR